MLDKEAMSICDARKLKITRKASLPSWKSVLPRFKVDNGAELVGA